MRYGVALSAVVHVLLVSSLMLGTPKPFDAQTAPIEVDLVRAEDVDQPKPEEKPEPQKPETPNLWELPQEKPHIDLPRLSPSEQRQAAAKAKQAPAESQPAPQPPANNERAAPSPSPSPPQSPAPPQSGLSMARQAPAPARPAPSIFDPANIPALMDLPNAQSSGFDAEAVVKADISTEERAAFKSHLRKCWKLGGAAPAPSTRVVLRINLKRDGTLANDPVLIEASASHDGLTVLNAAKRALKDCQPFAFLPGEKYREWRVLDLSFTPRDMAGGT